MVALESRESWLELLFQPALYPVYVALVVIAITVWVVTTPIRNVGWSLCAAVCEIGWQHAKLSAQVIEGYLTVAKDEGLRARPSSEYLWLLFEGFFTVPMAILKREGDTYGPYGRLAFKGWDFAHEYWCVFLPDTAHSLWTSTGLYAYGTLKSCVDSYHRAEGITCGVFWIVLLSGAVCIYVPLTFLRILEILLFGWRGVLVLIGLLKLTDWIWSWGWWINYVTASGVVLMALLATVQELEIGDKLDKVSPTVVAQAGWAQVQADAALRRREESSTLRSLRSAPRDPVDEQGVLDIAVDEQSATPTEGERSPAAIQAELRQSQQRVEQLQVEFEANSEVRRGRQTASRGECPAAGTVVTVPTPPGQAFQA